MKTLTNEEKDLLLKDLSARLSYGVRVCYKIHSEDKPFDVTLSGLLLDYFKNKTVVEVKAYLRPLISMTDEEALELNNINPYDHEHSVDFYNKHHFDYRGLIPMGLAIEVTDENNPYKNQ